MISILTDTLLKEEHMSRVTRLSPLFGLMIVGAILLGACAPAATPAPAPTQAPAPTAAPPPTAAPAGPDG